MLRGKDPSWKTWILWISWLDKYEVKKLLQVRISTFLEKGPKFNKAYRMWIFPWIKLSWHICSMWDKLGWLIDSDNFSVRGYLTLVRKDSITHMHGLAVYLKERLSFAQDLSLENSADSYLCFWPALLHSALLLFPLLITFFVFIHGFWFFFI